jgi:NAD(P)-dependent dehydrogenase (short-subunit alcohol dehydrogenase family)
MSEGQTLEGKVILVTGAGRGIGREIALLAGSLGAKVVVVDPGVGPDGVGGDLGPAQEVADAIKTAGGEAIASFEAVGDMDAGERIVRTALDAFGKLDGLVNNAGILRDRMVFNMTEEEWDIVLKVHLKGMFTTIKPASILFRQQRYGRIINFSSESGMRGNTGQANYGAAKAGITGLTRVVARDLGRYGVTVNAICPSAATRLTATVPAAAAAIQAASGIMGGGEFDQDSELNHPRYVAPMICYLLSDDAWDITGQVFHVGSGEVGILSYSYPPKRTIYKDVTKNGKWSMDELREMMPVLVQDLQNPAPPPDSLSVPGRPVAEQAPA